MIGKRVEGKAAIVVGGGQTPGQTVGNGRATAIVLGREGAHVCIVDRHLASAQDTADMIRREGGEAWAFAADVTREDDVARLMAAARERFGRIEVIAARDRRVPLGRRMGTGWDVANAALFLHSEEAGFITGVSLIVDGGESVAWGS
jgi:NAD(P)-dependent dehydrogenase (short-subunit alcohol dehydrogenase family)